MFEYHVDLYLHISFWKIDSGIRLVGLIKSSWPNLEMWLYIKWLDTNKTIFEQQN